MLNFVRNERRIFLQDIFNAKHGQFLILLTYRACRIYFNTILNERTIKLYECKGNFFPTKLKLITFLVN